MSDDATVFIVDDDPSIRHSLSWLLESVKLNVEAFASAEEFLQQVGIDRIGCLILDVRMPGMSGLELQEALMARAMILPVIILTGHGDVPMAVRAMANGAFDFLQKPFNGPQLLERINAAISKSRELWQEKTSEAEVLSRYQTLTPRERQIMEMIVAGKANKVMAFDLGISLRTVEVHRHRVMEKMAAKSVAELIYSHLQIADKIPVT